MTGAVTPNVASRRRRKRILKRAKGYRGARSKLIRYSKDDRSPLPAIYRMFAGEITGDKILKEIGQRIGALVGEDGMIAYMLEFDFLPNPYLEPAGTLNDKAPESAKRGERIFNRPFEQLAGRSCASCHIPSDDLCVLRFATCAIPSCLVVILADGITHIRVGLDISHDGFHRHGAYIVATAEMPGFPRSEQTVLAFVIASQMGEIDLRNTQSMPSVWRETALRISVIHRLAVLLNRSRSSRELPAIGFAVSRESIRLTFPEGWLTDNPLTVADLHREVKFLANAGFGLTFA